MPRPQPHDAVISTACCSTGQPHAAASYRIPCIPQSTLQPAPCHTLRGACSGAHSSQQHQSPPALPPQVEHCLCTPLCSSSTAGCSMTGVNPRVQGSCQHICSSLLRQTTEFLAIPLTKDGPDCIHVGVVALPSVGVRVSVAVCQHHGGVPGYSGKQEQDEGRCCPADLQADNAK